MSGDKPVNEEELKKAFTKVNKEDKKSEKPKKSNKKAPAVFFAIGMVALVGGLSFLIYRLVAGPSMADAEFLISNDEWVEEGEPSVIWKFTEVGKGTLTTDGHQTNYDFIWTLENGQMKVETSWLYTISDEFSYSLDQGSKTLTLKNEDKGVEVKFKASEKQE